MSRKEIETALLLKGKAEIKTSKFKKVEELEQFYKAHGFKTKISTNEQGKFILDVRFKNVSND